MVRLSKVWLKLENSTKFDALPIYLDETLILMNKPFVYLLKKVFQFRIIEGIIEDSFEYVLFSEGKNMIKNKMELLQTNDEHLMEKIQILFDRDIKIKKKAQKIFLKFDGIRKTTTP